MACSEDLTPGNGIDDLLNRLREESNDGLQDNIMLMVAMLIGIDEHFGLQQEGDYVLMHPGYAMWFISRVTPLSTEFVDAMNNQDVQALEHLMREQPFDVLCESPSGPEYTELYPELLRGKTIKLRVMTSIEGLRLDMLQTVRADGTLIYRPGFKTKIKLDEPQYMNLSQLLKS